MEEDRVFCFCPMFRPRYPVLVLLLILVASGLYLWLHPGREDGASTVGSRQAAPDLETETLLPPAPWTAKTGAAASARADAPGPGTYSGGAPSASPGPLEPVKRPSGETAAEAARLGWDRARLIGQWRSAARSPGAAIRRVTLLQPADLPYAVRVEEWLAPEGTSSGAVSGRGEPILGKTEMVADHVLVQLAEGQGEDELRATLASVGGALGKQVSARGLYRAAVPVLAPDAAPELVASLQKLGDELRFAEPDFIVRTTAVPNDPYYSDGHLWGLHNTGQAAFPEDRDAGRSGTADADIDAPEAWAVRTDASGVLVAVIDTGINYQHEDIAANMWVNPGEVAGDGIDNDGNGVIDDVHGLNAISDGGDPLDDQDHGTHTAGTIGAVGNNGLGTTGVAWQVQLMAGKFLGASGGGAIGDAIECIDYAVAQGADILSNSWGGGSFSQAALEAIEAARAAGALFVVAAGNTNDDNDLVAAYPTNYEVDNIVSVAATDRNDALAEFSSYGFGAVQLAAPGVAVWSPVHGASDAYDTFSGTSMACPHVTGALALLRAEFPADSPYALIHRLLNGVDPVAGLAGKVQTGGRLNLHRSLTTANARPFNDDFARRVILAEEVNYIRAINHHATAEAGEPLLDGSSAHDSTLWYAITATVNGEIGIETSAASTISTVIGVFTGDGSSLASLVPEPSLVGASSGNATFDGVAGTTYYLAVSGQNGAEGLLTLRVAGPPENNNLEDAFELTGTEAFTSGTLFNADKEPGEPDHAGNAGGSSIWWHWTCPASAEYTLSTRTRLDQLHDTLLAVYTADDPAQPTMAGLSLVGANDDEPGGLVSSRVRFQGVAGTTYFIAVDSKNGVGGDVVLKLFTPPGNDDFADAYALWGDLPLTVRGTTWNASRETGEPDHAGMGGQTSVWYAWTPSTDMTVSILTEGFADTVLGVYTGISVDALTEVVSDDDSGTGTNAQVAFEARRNVTYHIAVDYLDYFLGAEFDLRFKEVIIPDNDAIASAELLQGTQAETSGTTIGAGRESNEPGVAGFDTVWFQWVAPTSGEFGVYLDAATDVAPYVKVFTGSDLSGFSDFSEIASDVFSGIGYDAFAHFQATAGERYYLQIAGFGDVETSFDLSLRPVASFRPDNDALAEATVIDPAVGLDGFHTQNYGATAEPGEPNHAGLSGRHTLWWRLTVGPGQGGSYVFSPVGTEHDAAGVAVYTASDPAAPTMGTLSLVADNSATVDEPYTETRWTAVEGETYFIALETTVSSNYGLGRVIVTCQKVAANAQFAGAIAIPAGGGNYRVHNHGAVHETGEPDPAGGGGRKSLWWTFTPTVTRTYQIDTFGSERYWHERSEQSFATGRTWRAVDTQIGIYTGTTPDALTLVEEVDSYTNESYDLTWSTSNRWSRIIRTLQAGTTYRILVDTENIRIGNPPDGTTTGRIHLNVQPLDAPANDDFANATELSGSGFIQAFGNNLGATVETGEPQHGLSAGGQSVWWKWTAPESATYHASSAGLLYNDAAVRNTGIGVYVGTDVASLSPLGTDDDSAGFNSNSAAVVAFNASAGTTYYFAVDADDLGAQGSEEGELSLILARAPDHDDFANAREMSGTRWTDQTHNIGATTEPGEPLIEFWNPQPATNRKSVWWRWTAPVSGLVTIDTYGSQSVPVLGVFTGTSVDSLATVAWERSSGDPWNGRSRAINGNVELSFNATAGTTYHIALQGAGYVEPIESTIQIRLDGPAGIPATPTGFVATRIDGSRVDLSWVDEAVDETVYVLERSGDGTNWSVLDDQINQSSEAYSDYTVDPLQSIYFYRLHAEGPGGVGASVVTSTAPPAAPATLTATAAGSFSIELIWEDVLYESGYTVERSPSGVGDWTVLTTTAADVVQLTDPGLESGTRYFYRVFASGNGDSGYSPVASAVTATAPSLLAYEGFDYATTGPLGTQAGGSGWEGGWGSSGATGGEVSGSSTLPIAPGSMLTPGNYSGVTGNQAGDAASGVVAVRKLAGGIDLGTDGVTYFSFLVSTSGGGAFADPRLGFYAAGTHSAKVFDVGVKALSALISEGSNEVTGQAYPQGEPVLLIGKITHAATGADTLALQLYRRSDTITSEPVIWGAVHSFDSSAVLNRVFLDFTNNIDAIDEIRIGSSFEAMHQTTVPPRPTFADWGSAYGITDPADDSDGNGLPALFEYAFALTPGTPGSLPTIGAVEMIGGAPAFTLSFLQRNGTGDLIYRVQYSEDLVDWHTDQPLWSSESGDISHLVRATDHGDGTRTLTVRAPADTASSDRMFLRVQVELP